MKDNLKSLLYTLNHKKIKLLFKVSMISLSIVLFISCMFIAMNETKRTIDGEALTVYKIEDGFQIAVGDKVYEFQKDPKKIDSLKSFIKNHESILPYPLQIIKSSNRVLIYLINNFK